MNRRYFLKSGAGFGAAALLAGAPAAFALGGGDRLGKVVRTQAEWKRMLTPAQYRVTRLKGTEAPHSSPLNKVRGRGTFHCVCCDLPLFSTETKFDSGTGWPSFWAPISKANVREEADRSLSDTRTEVLCARCDAHLGHVFDDGPKPTGLRYCMNGVAMTFTPAEGSVS